MRQKDLIGQIRKIVHKNGVQIPFKSSDFSFLKRSPSFLSKHAVGNGKYQEYFIRCSRGKYILIN